MKNALVLLIFLLLCSQGSSQVFNVAYVPNDTQQAYGDSKPSSLLSDASGSILTVHNINEGPGSTMHDAHILKANANGAVIWSMNYGDPGYDDQLKTKVLKN